jgi:hypothetical protein
MAILRKKHLEQPLAELAQFYERLKKTVEGEAPPSSLAEHYQMGQEEFIRDFVNVDLLQVEKAIGFFKVEVNALKQILKRGVLKRSIQR